MRALFVMAVIAVAVVAPLMIAYHQTAPLVEPVSASPLGSVEDNAHALTSMSSKLHDLDPEAAEWLTHWREHGYITPGSFSPEMWARMSQLLAVEAEGYRADAMYWRGRAEDLSRGR